MQRSIAPLHGCGFEMMKIILVLELQGFASVILPLLGLLSPRLGSFEGAPRTLLRSLFVFDHIMQSIFYTL